MRIWFFNRVLNPLVLAVLRSPGHRLLSGSLVVLTYTGRRSGRRRKLPVMYAQRDGELVVFAASPGEKRWWRNFRGREGPVGVLLRGRWVEGRAETITDDPAALEAARATYGARFPRSAAAVRGGEKAVLVRITLPEEGNERT